MMSKYALPLLAIIGLVFAISAVIRGNETPAISLPPVQAAKVPFASYVAGAGIIEASTENIAIGTPVAGIVTAIYVKWSDRVNTGDPLFKIDDRDMQGQLCSRPLKSRRLKQIWRKQITCSSWGKV
jgi:HlyD family secretion protein